jgi:hypothetical protein
MPSAEAARARRGYRFQPLVGMQDAHAETRLVHAVQHALVPLDHRRRQPFEPPAGRPHLSRNTARPVAEQHHASIRHRPAAAGKRESFAERSARSAGSRAVAVGS